MFCSSIHPFAEKLVNLVNLDSWYLWIVRFELISSLASHLARGFYALVKRLLLFRVLVRVFRGYFLIRMTGRNATVRKRASTRPKSIFDNQTILH